MDQKTVLKSYYDGSENRSEIYYDEPKNRSECFGVSNQAIPNLYREYNRYMDIVLLVILGVLAIGFAYLNWWFDQ
jgi:hypothetical protein